MAPLRSRQARNSLRQPPPKIVGPFPDSDDDELAAAFDEEPPSKRIRTSRKSVNRSKWIPGGRGGGGRHIEVGETAVGTETPRTNEDWSERRPRAARSTMAPARGPRTSTRRTAVGARHRYSTATAAAAAVAHGDGYKPREERAWEEFHPDLELESAFAVIESEEVDGIVKLPTLHNGLKVGQNSEVDENDQAASHPSTPARRKPGRPFSRADSMLNSILTPEAPKVVPLPGPNPRERLTYQDHPSGCKIHFCHMSRKTLLK
jgi:NuA3 HAT complex component NTO1